MQNMPIGIFRGDDTDAFSYQTIVGTIKTDLDLTGCKAVFRYLGFSMEFDPIPEDRKLTIVIPADETKKFPPGLGYASLRVYDSEDRLKTFSNRIMVFVATKTPMFGSEEFEVDFNVRASLEPLKFFVGPNPDDFDEYRGYVEKVIDRASASKYGLAILLDAIDSDLGANDGVAATPVAVKAAYAAIIQKLTDDYYTSEQTDEAIDRVAAYYITRNAAGDAFETKAQLNSATVFYSGGKVRTPTRNDYCVVLADEMHDNAEYRYIYAVADGETTGRWQPQFPVEGVMTVDQTVQKNSQNPVSGGGVWSAIWGALASLPTGFTSLYDWCVAQLAGKVPTSRTVNGEALSSDVTLDADDVGALPAEHSEGGYYDLTDVGIDDLNLPSGTHVNGETPILSGDVVAPDSSATSGKVADAAETYQALDAKQDTLSPAQLANIDAVPNKLDKSGGTMSGDLTFDNGVGDSQIIIKDADGYPLRIDAQGILVGKWNDDENRYDYYRINWPDATDNGTLANLQNLSDEYDENATYALNALCVHNSLLYRCTTAITTSEAWTEAHWALATVEDVLAALRTGKANRAPNPTTGNLAALDAQGNPTDAGWTAGDLARYALTTKTISNGAVTLDDRAINAVAVSSSLASLTINFPTATSGKARDFGLRLTVASGITTAPELVLPQGVTCENADGEAPEIGADGAATILYFTETASGVFLVKGEVLTAITA